MPTTSFDNGLTANLTNAGMVAGTTSTYTTTAQTNCAIRGKFATPLAIQTNAATPTLDANTGVAFSALQANQACALVLGVNQAGAIQMVQGPIIGTNPGITTTPGALLNVPQFPALPTNFCPLAYTVVEAAPSSAGWIPGTGSWTAAGITATAFQNVVELPDRPQAS